jgi:hypothetical protein
VYLTLDLPEPPKPPVPKEWDEMATQEQVQDALRVVLSEVFDAPLPDKWNKVPSTYKNILKQVDDLLVDPVGGVPRFQYIVNQVGKIKDLTLTVPEQTVLRKFRANPASLSKPELTILANALNRFVT